MLTNQSGSEVSDSEQQVQSSDIVPDSTYSSSITILRELRQHNLVPDASGSLLGQDATGTANFLQQKAMFMPVDSQHSVSNSSDLSSHDTGDNKPELWKYTTGAASNEHREWACLFCLGVFKNHDVTRLAAHLLGTPGQFISACKGPVSRSALEEAQIHTKRREKRRYAQGGPRKRLTDSERAARDASKQAAREARDSKRAASEATKQAAREARDSKRAARVASQRKQPPTIVQPISSDVLMGEAHESPKIDSVATGAHTKVTPRSSQTTSKDTATSHSIESSSAAPIDSVPTLSSIAWKNAVILDPTHGSYNITVFDENAFNTLQFQTLEDAVAHTTMLERTHVLLNDPNTSRHQRFVATGGVAFTRAKAWYNKTSTPAAFLAYLRQLR